MTGIFEKVLEFTPVLLHEVDAPSFQSGHPDSKDLKIRVTRVSFQAA
jgi:hypothetical protein